MTQEDKQLLLKDLCTRLPYDVLVSNNGQQEFLISIEYGESFVTKDVVTKTPQFTTEAFGGQRHLLDIEEIKPYLRPMSSMTEEEHRVCREFKRDIMTQGYGAIEIYVTRYTNWLDKRHFDWRKTGNNETLIEAGLALEAPEGMYKTE